MALLFASAVVRPVCTCSAHLMWSCSRFSMLNDSGRTAKYEVALRNVSCFYSFRMTV